LAIFVVFVEFGVSIQIVAQLLAMISKSGWVLKEKTYEKAEFAVCGYRFGFYDVFLFI
jgi:hypothetical protein